MKLRILARPHDPNAYDLDWQSRVWRWLESHPLADRMHRWVVDAEGELVGHLAALPQYYRINGQRVVAHTPAEYMVLPGYGFHAITLMRQFFRTCENCVTGDVMPAVISVEKRLGAEESGSLQHAAKLLNMAGVPAYPTSIPVPVTKLCNWGLQAVDSALMATLPVDHLRVEVLEGFDNTFDELFESVAAAVPCVPEKDAAFLRWRYGPSSPQSGVTVLGTKEGDTLLGFAVLNSTADGDTGYVLDLTTRPGRQRRSAGAATWCRPPLQAATRKQRQIPAGPVAELASVERSAASRLCSLEQRAFFAVGQVHGCFSARDRQRHYQLVLQLW